MSGQKIHDPTYVKSRAWSWLRLAVVSIVSGGVSGAWGVWNAAHDTGWQRGVWIVWCIVFPGIFASIAGRSISRARAFWRGEWPE